jgi:hypothetical protein
MNIEINDDLLNKYKNAFQWRFFETSENTVIEDILIEDLRRNCIDGFTADPLTQVESLFKFKKDLWKLDLLNSKKDFFIYNTKKMIRINDYYGLGYGDNVLKEIALALKNNINENLIYRIAGEKFFSFGEYSGKLPINDHTSVEVSQLEVKENIRKKELFMNPETILDFIFEGLYSGENELFKLKNRYLV